jgi:hypothetical protein
MPDDLAPRGFYEGLTARSLMAGWARREHPTGSKSNMCVHVWRAAEARAALQEASRFVGTDVAERRNLIMVNPAPGNTYATTRNIVAAYQMIQPGETARSHRHTPAALRLVLDAADDVYTVVDGMRVDMTPGDVVLTPSWCWHGHANDGNEAAFWLDFLDVPFVQHLEATLFEPHPEAFQRPTQRSSAFCIPLTTALAGQQTCTASRFPRKQCRLSGCTRSDCNPVLLPNVANKWRTTSTRSSPGPCMPRSTGRRTKSLHAVTFWLCRCARGTCCMGSMMRPCCGSPTSRSWRSSACYATLEHSV